jgi:DNA gyrase subunit B
VEKTMHHKVLKTKRFEIYLHLVIGTEEDSKALNIELRYHKVIIMCDADVDGSHISLIFNILFPF